MPPKHMTEEERNIFPEEVLKALAVSTEATAEDLATDDWDSEFNCSYSADGRKLLDAENFLFGQDNPSAKRRAYRSMRIQGMRVDYEDKVPEITAHHP